MPNEILFLITLVLSLSCVLITFKLGRLWTVAYIVATQTFLMVTVAKGTLIFGLPAGIGHAMFASIFLATDMLTERYGKQAGFQVVRIAIAVYAFFMVFSQLAIATVPMAEMQAYSDALDVVMGGSFRIMSAGVIAFTFSQTFDVWFYHFIHKKTGEQHLWLRNNLSTMTSQFLDSTIFFTIAFYGILPNDVLIQAILAGYIAKACVAIFDTPFMYLSKRIKPLDALK